MASSPSATVPTAQTGATVPDPSPQPDSTGLTHVPPVVPIRRSSLGSRKKGKENEVASPPHTPSHSRNGSGGSIRTVIRLPRAKEKEKEKEQEKHKIRKDNISAPLTLDSRIAFEPPMSEDQKDGFRGYGEAI